MEMRAELISLPLGEDQLSFTELNNPSAEAPLQFSNMAPVSIDVNGTAISYVGATKIKRAVDDGPYQVLEPNDRRRNLRQDLLELATAVDQARKLMVTSLLEQDIQLMRYYRSSLESPRLLPARFIETLEMELSDSRSGILRTEQYQRNKQTVSELEEIMRDFLKARNTNPALIRLAAFERNQDTEWAKAILKDAPRLDVSFEISGLGWATGGVVGRAMLLAESLLDTLPNLHITVNAKSRAFSAASATFGRSDQSRLLMNEWEAQPSEHPILFHFGAYGNINQDSIGRSNYFNLYPFGLVLDTGLSRTDYLTEHVISSPISNDLNDPQGTLLLNQQLRDDRRERDTWPLTKLESERKDWRSHTLSNVQNLALESLATSEGWQVDKSIWGLAYIQEAHQFIEEIKLLAYTARQHPDELPWLTGNKQIIIHTRLGAMAERLIQTQELAARGIKFVMSDGEIISSDRARLEGSDPRITVVFHKPIDNEYFKRAISQLVGCPVRDQEQKHWIDFPVWVTGSASWLEAISAGAIARHDGCDFKFSKTPQIQAVICKQLALQDATGSQTWEQIYSESAQLLPAYLMGVNPVIANYRCLEKWSEQARRFSDALSYFNTTDDILITLAKRHIKTLQSNHHS